MNPSTMEGVVHEQNLCTPCQDPTSKFEKDSLNELLNPL